MLLWHSAMARYLPFIHKSLARQQTWYDSCTNEADDKLSVIISKWLEVFTETNTPFIIHNCTWIHLSTMWEELQGNDMLLEWLSRRRKGKGGSVISKFILQSGYKEWKLKQKKLSKGSPSNYKIFSKLVFRQKICRERCGVGDSMSSITFNDRDEGMPP